MFTPDNTIIGLAVQHINWDWPTTIPTSIQWVCEEASGIAISNLPIELRVEGYPYNTTPETPMFWRKILSAAKTGVLAALPQEHLKHVTTLEVAHVVGVPPHRAFRNVVLKGRPHKLGVTLNTLENLILEDLADKLGMSKPDTIRFLLARYPT